MGSVREEVEDYEGHMTQEWADEYSEEVTFYVSPEDKPRTCQNPHNGHYPIFNIWVMRSEVSGDVKEIGTHCHQRWLRLQGYETEPWFGEYEKRLILSGKEQIGSRIESTERKRIRKDARIKWLDTQVKEGNIRLNELEMPFENFKTRELAEKWAEEHGGYVHSDFRKQVRIGPDTRKYPKFQPDTREKEERHFWKIFTNPIYRSEY